MRLVGLLASLTGGSPEWDRVPQAVEPTPTEARSLLAGETVVRQQTGKGASRGVAMAWVEAPPSAVWAVILDVERYVEFLPYVTASKLVDGGAELELTTKGYVTRYKQTTIDHSADGYVTFEMKPLGWSPMRSTAGWWRVSAWKGGTLVVYSVDVATAWYLPKSTHDRAAAIGLPRMVELVAERARP